MKRKWIYGIPWGKSRSVKWCMTLKLCCLLLLVCILPASGKVYSQQQKIDVEVTNVSIEALIKEIKAKVAVDFLYNLTELDKGGNVSVKMKRATVEEILTAAFKGKDLGFTIVNGVIVIRPKAQSALPQTKEMVKGVVKDKEGNPLPGVTVMIQGTTVGVITNTRGEYEIPRTEGEMILVFSFVGMEKVSVPYKGQKSLDVVMEESVYTLEQADVIYDGYQYLDKRHLTSAITSVKASDVLIPGMTSIDQALEGRIPELRLMTNSGEVGTTPRIRVRGTSSLVGNREPLWVLDGFIMRDPVEVSNEDLNNPDYINIIGNAIAGINPQDIDRIDILKDAAATALYGTRAANGVIVVTTKRGAIGRTRFTYNHVSKFTRRPRYSDKAVNLMNSQERVAFGKDLADLHYKFPGNMPMVGYEGALYNYYNGKLTFEEFQDEVARYEAVNTNWFKLLTQDTYSQEHTFGVSGGSKDVRYYVSVGYNRENGVSKTTFTERYTTRSSLDFTFSENFRASLGLNANIQKKNHLMDGIDAMNYAYNTTRALPCYNEDGSLFYYDKTSTSRSQEKFRYNILNEIDNSSNEYDGNTVGMNLNVRYQVMNALTVTLGGNYSRSSTTQEKWWGEKTFYVACLKNGEIEDVPKTGDLGYSYLPFGGILTTNNTRAENYTFRLQLESHNTLGADGKHIIDALVGYEMNGSNSKKFQDENRGYMKERGLQFVNVTDLDDYPHWKEWVRKNHRTISNSISHQLSGYLTLSYSYQNHFSLNVNGRFDASNAFGSRSNERFLPIWSVSGMWNLKENVCKDVSFLSELRFRTSYGVQGNMLEDQSPNLIIQQGTIKYTENVSTIARYPNPNLRWEETRSADMGLDFALFDSRIQVQTSLYWRTTDNCFTNVKVSSVNGVPGNNYMMNGGKLSNTGYSVYLLLIPIKLKDFSWSFNTYFDGNLNKVRSETVETYTLDSYLNGTALVDGEAISTFYSHRYLGLDPTNGSPLFNDYHDRQHLLEGKSLEETVLMTMEKSGQRDPIFSGSFSTSFTYKKLSFGMHFSYNLGAKMRLFSLYQPVLSGISAEANVRKEFLNRWRVPGDEKITDVPAIMSPSDPEYDKYRAHFSGNAKNIQKFGSSVWQMYDVSNLRVVSANYLKCTSMSLRYTFDSKQLRGTPLSSVSLSLNATNVFTVSSRDLKGQDPSQAGFAKPNLSLRPAYTFQFSVTF